MNYRLGTQLPGTSSSPASFDHLKVIYRSYQHAFETPQEAEKELNDWVSRVRRGPGGGDRGVARRRPLRKVKVLVLDTEHEGDWYRLGVQLRPHFKYMGAFFTLSVSSRIEKR